MSFDVSSRAHRAGFARREGRVAIAAAIDRLAPPGGSKDRRRNGRLRSAHRGEAKGESSSSRARPSGSKAPSPVSLVKLPLPLKGVGKNVVVE